MVLLGGTSSERDVSRASGLRIAGALRERGHTVLAYDSVTGAMSEADERKALAAGVVHREPPDEAMLRRMRADEARRWEDVVARGRQHDVMFLGLHGGQGEDGTIQAMLDFAGLRYTGSGHLASALAMDKDLSKHLFRSAGVATADWLMAPADGETVERTLGLPVVVKPSKQGSTVGLSVVRERKALAAAVEEAFRFDDEVMIEGFVPGRELTVAVLGDDALPVGEIKPVHEIYDYECKYTAGMAVEEFPAALAAREAAEVQRLALAAYRGLKLAGCARIDFRMAPDGAFYCLEANTLPGMTATSLVPQAAAAAGIGFPELCERIAVLAMDRKRER